MYYAKIGLFFTVLTLLAGGGGYLFAGLGGLSVALLVILGFNIGIYRWGQTLVLRLHGAQELTEANAPECFAILRALASRANIPAPRLYEVKTSTPNAFAIGRSRQHATIVVTTGLLQLLEQDELASVLAHEIARIKHRDILSMTMTAALAGILTIPVASTMPQWPFLADTPPIGKDGLRTIIGILASMIGTPLMAWNRLFITRTRVFEADEAGAWLTGDPQAMIQALRKLDYWSQVIPMQAGSPVMAHLYTMNPYALGKWGHRFDTHPTTVDRILYLKFIICMHDETTWADDIKVSH